MNRSYPRWLVGLALVFGGYGCAADATSVATAIDETETPIVPSGDPAPESEEGTEPRASAMSSMAVAIVEPLPTFRPDEEGLMPRSGEEALTPRTGEEGLTPRSGEEGLTPRTGEEGLTPRPREEVLGPQPVPWCIAMICEAAICRCFTPLIDRANRIDLTLTAGREIELGRPR